MKRIRRPKPDPLDALWGGPWSRYGFSATVAHSGDCGTPWIYPGLPGHGAPHCPDCVRIRSRKAHRAIRRTHNRRIA
jgi:hypothetical protein